MFAIDHNFTKLNWREKVILSGWKTAGLNCEVSRFDDHHRPGQC